MSDKHGIDDRRPEPTPAASGDAGAAGEAEPKGTPTSDRHATETAHHDEQSHTGVERDHAEKK